MKKTIITGVAVLCAGFSLAGELLLQQDFNTKTGEASLMDIVLGKQWLKAGSPKLVNSDLPPTGQGGFVGEVKCDSSEKNYFQAKKTFGSLKSITLGGWVKVGVPDHTHGYILNNQMTIERQGFGLNVMSNGLKVALAVNAHLLVTDCVIAPDVWTFVAVTYDGTKNTDNVKVYVSTDGQTLSLAQTLTHNRRAITPSSAGVKSGMFFSTGLFDSLRVYGSEKDDTGVISEEEIKAWMNSSTLLNVG